MPRTTKPLSATQIKQAKPRAKEYNLADGQGLYLRVKPTGAKHWLFNYQKPHTKQRSNISLGSYPAVSLAEAKKERDLCQSLLAKDIDPREQKIVEKREKANAHANTLGNIYSEWLKLKQQDVSSSYFKKIENRLDKYIIPKLGKRPLHKITAVEAISVIRPLADDGKLETVKKICRWFNEIMVYAVNSGIILHNPLSGIGKAFNAPKTVNLPTLRPDQLPKLVSTIEEASIKPMTKHLMLWQLHTIVRPAEASNARWEEIDFDKKVWEIPAERMKKNRPHLVPLTSQTIGILQALKPLSGHLEHIFTSDINPRKPANSQTVNMALKRMGFKDQIVSHGFRALASTTLNEQEFDPDVIEVALAHVDSNSIRATYNRSEYLEQRKKMMQWWSDQIAGINRKTSGKMPSKKNLSLVSAQ